MSNILPTQRLIFLRHLYEIADSAAKQYAPLSWTSILSFHDVLELFLNAAAEYVKAEYTPRQTIFEIWASIDRKIDPLSLAQSVAVKRLVRAREGLKHSFIAPSVEQISEFSSTMRIFLEENTSLIFAVDFRTLSLQLAITDAETQGHFDEADELFANSHFQEAFDVLDNIWDYYARAGVLKDERKDRLIDLEFRGKDVTRLAIEIEDHLIDLSYSIAVVGYGIALEKYRLFNLVMILRRQGHGDANTITNDFQFCKIFL